MAAHAGLQAPIVWRDHQLATTNILTFREFREQVRSNNRSGVPSLHFLKTVRQPQGRHCSKCEWHARQQARTSSRL